jgi:kinesin family protein 6/9
LLRWLIYLYVSHTSLIFRISYLEIYNEVIFDLLSTLPGETTPTKATPTCPNAGAGGSSNGLCVSEDERGVVSVKGLSLRLATSEEDALNMLFEVNLPVIVRFV